ncbi:hypothetical protein RHMOL_Rhmol04G0111300 [Rhododendron molle]|uniref:Uncharacterized protein n=1 Tax=Rhododendron molle TaxID=49168 RepID=A0ACC0NZ40_RHOML|nr:hypothetical protein RHMOL_Rhmol04G0111300 [Rhododendron molle]
MLHLFNNNLSGSIPSEIGKLKGQVSLSFHTNNLNGSIPPSFGNLTSLSLLHLYTNQLSDYIPNGLGNLKSIVDFQVSENRLRGFIPASFGNLSELIQLLLSANYLSGPIPQEFRNLKNLITLELGENQFSGHLPDIWQGGKLQSFTIYSNQFIGRIPKSLRHCSSLVRVRLDGNQLTGSISEDFQRKITRSIGKDISLVYNGSQSKFTNWGDTIRDRRALLLLGAFVGFLIVSHRRKRKSHVEDASKNKDVFSISTYDGRALYNDILKATKDFDAMYCIGEGGYGAVYKAKLPLGNTVAVKKLHSLSEKDDRRGFLNELDEEAKELDWPKRVNIVKGMAHALSYLHHDCTPPIVHHDISSNNILIDEENEARVSDFGTAKLLKLDSSNWSALADTYEYVTPELVYTMKVTEKCDVYNFGVLAIEVIKEKHPGDFASSLPTTAVENVQL